MHKKADSVSTVRVQSLHRLLQEKAREANAKLGFDYYCDDPKAYVFVDTVKIQRNALMIFFCPKSRSTLSVRIEDISNEEEAS